MVTAKIESNLSNNLLFTNLTRAGKTNMKRVLTGINAINTNSSNNPNDWTVNRSRQGVDQEN